MRITDSRYDRDRMRLSVALRLIAHQARTHTIHCCTGLSGDRIRKLFRTYAQGSPGTRVRRLRGRSPGQMAYFRRSAEHELQAAALATLLSWCGLLRVVRRLPGTRIEDVARFCDVYEAFLSICPASLISFEHAWFLAQVLAHRDEFVISRCPDCAASWVRDRLDLVPDNCAACRTGGLPRRTLPVPD
jgi:hypothetical protein